MYPNDDGWGETKACNKAGQKIKKVIGRVERWAMGGRFLGALVYEWMTLGYMGIA